MDNWSYEWFFLYGSPCMTLVYLCDEIFMNIHEDDVSDIKLIRVVHTGGMKVLFRVIFGI